MATAGLNPADIAVPIRSQFSDVENIEIHLVKVNNIDLVDQDVEILGSDRRLPFDYLVMACGANHSYFAHPEWEKFAPGLKTVEQATEIRRRILLAFEEAENEFDPDKQKRLLTFIIVGGGPTGVELAGAIADISKTVLIRDFHRINPSHARVILIEAGSRVLSAFADDLSKKALKDLTELSVDVRLNSRVEDINEKGVTVNNSVIYTKNVFWAAGVQANKLNLNHAVDTDKAGRIKVQKDLSIPGFKNIFCIGDMSAVEMEPGKTVPGLAPAAIQQGKHVAKMIQADRDGKPRPEFKYLDKGIMATIGKNKAVLQAGPVHMSGYFAWLAWLFIHVVYLVGFKNRVAVITYWTWSYLFSKRGARLITDKY